MTFFNKVKHISGTHPTFYKNKFFKTCDNKAVAAGFAANTTYNKTCYFLHCRKKYLDCLKKQSFKVHVKKIQNYALNNNCIVSFLTLFKHFLSKSIRVFEEKAVKNFDQKKNVLKVEERNCFFSAFIFIFRQTATDILLLLHWNDSARGIIECLF